MPECGTLWGYTSGCRCDECRAVWADYHRAYRTRPDVQAKRRFYDSRRYRQGLVTNSNHGTVAAYQYGCRCQPCLDVGRAYHRAWKRSHKRDAK